jgi:hypothetical protein
LDRINSLDTKQKLIFEIFNKINKTPDNISHDDLPLTSTSIQHSSNFHNNTSLLQPTESFQPSSFNYTALLQSLIEQSKSGKSVSYFLPG